MKASTLDQDQILRTAIGFSVGKTEFDFDKPYSESDPPIHANRTRPLSMSSILTCQRTE